LVPFPPAAGALPPPLDAGAPPWLLQAASAADAAATTASARSVLRERSILIDLSSLQAAGQEADCGVLRGGAVVVRGYRGAGPEAAVVLTPPFPEE
jgi:hypothetical protein